MHHLNANKTIAKNGLRRIVEDTEVAKEKFEVLSQLNEQQVRVDLVVRRARQNRVSE